MQRQLVSHLAKNGHFGVFEGDDGMPQLNARWGCRLDVIGVALDSKPVSITVSPDIVSSWTDPVDRHWMPMALTAAAHEGVCYIKSEAFNPEVRQTCVMFKRRNLLLAVLMGRMHWTNGGARLVDARLQEYVVGTAFGYPPKDIRARMVARGLSQNIEWFDLGAREKRRIWDASQAKVRRVHTKFEKVRREGDKVLEAMLASLGLKDAARKLVSHICRMTARDDSA